MQCDLGNPAHCFRSILTLLCAGRHSCLSGCHRVIIPASISIYYYFGVAPLATTSWGFYKRAQGRGDARKRSDIAYLRFAPQLPPCAFLRHQHSAWYPSPVP